jgi:hypothetical protein
MNFREVNETLYQFKKPFVVSGEKFAKAFGKIATPHREAIQATIDWYKSNATEH